MAKFKGYSLIFFALLCTSVIWAQKPYESEYWEKNWRDWPRPRFDYRVDTFAAIENIILREYFNSNSNISGEIYRHYSRFQYPSRATIEEHGSIDIQLPNYEVLADIDFRVWHDGLLVNEAKPDAIKEFYLDTLGADPFTKKMFAFRLTFPDLRKGSIVEVMVTCKGVPLPYRLTFEQSFPVIESSQRIKILSAFPLRFATDSSVKFEKEEIWDYNLYKFSRKHIPAHSIETSLSTAALDFPGVWVDWKDQVFYYDRDESDDWRELLPYLFYQGDLKDFVVYRNSLAEDFGLQQFYGSWIRPVRYFHGRGEEFQSNSAYAEGRLRLSKAYAEVWYEVEQSMERIVINNQEQNFDKALQLVLSAQEKAVRKYLKELPIEPPIFREYGLLCSHLEKLLNYFKYDYKLVLLSPKRFGRPPANFASPWTAVARGIIFRKDSAEDWNYVLPGPYMSQFYKANQLPPDLSEGWIQAFSRKDSVPKIMALPKVEVDPHGFHHVYTLSLLKDKGTWVQRDTLKLRGAFRSILANGYLQNDSVKDQLNYTNHQLIYQFEKRDSLLYSKPQVLSAEDSLRFILPLSEALSIRSHPSLGRSFALPLIFKAQWQYCFNTDDSLQIDVPLQKFKSNSVYDFDYSWSKTKSQWHLSFSLKLKSTVIDEAQKADFQELQNLLQEEFEFKIWNR